MGTLVAVAGALGVRFGLLTGAVGAPDPVAARNSGGRRYPAHLDVYVPGRTGTWWGDFSGFPLILQPPGLTFRLRPVPDRRSRWDADREGRQERNRVRAERERALELELARWRTVDDW